MKISILFLWCCLAACVVVVRGCEHHPDDHEATEDHRSLRRVQADQAPDFVEELTPDITLEYNDGRPTHAGVRCGAPQRTKEQNEAAYHAIMKNKQNGGNRRRLNSDIVIPTVFHNVHGSGGDGLLSQTTIDAQMGALNQGFSGTGFQFDLVATTFTENNAWYTHRYGSREELAMKSTLSAQYPTNQYLNVYTAAARATGPGTLLGYATFPDMYVENDPYHGTIIHPDTCPGGAFRDYNEGDVLIHEVGHYVGLYHTFQGGCACGACDNGGDYVADTPAQASATSGCPVVRDSCAGGGPDPIDNFMDYSYNTCQDKFTTGQVERAHDMMSTYKPTIYNAGPATCTDDANCDDGAFCNGAETCNAGVCQAGTPPCDDGIACTDDSCNEATDSCVSTPNDDLCDNGSYCDGVETCHALLGCQAGTAPNCGTFGCDEDNDQCNECSVNTDCTTDPNLYCASGNCVECTDDTHCLTAGETCQSNVCSSSTCTCSDCDLQGGGPCKNCCGPNSCSWTGRTGQCS